MVNSTLIDKSEITYELIQYYLKVGRCIILLDALDEVEKSKKDLVAQEKKNESLIMKINELASLDKIQEVADQEGLSYNNSNIKTIDEE